jgi:hypothetical protein
MAFLIEVIVDLSMDRAKFLQGSPTSKSLRRSFSPTERLMRVLGPIVASTTSVVAQAAADLRHRDAVGRQSVRDDFSRAAVFLQDPLQEF